MITNLSSELIMPKKRQKTYSLPQPIVDWLHSFYENEKDCWARAGITNETQLLADLVKNGQPHMEEMLDFLKQRKPLKRDDRQPP